MGKQAMGESFTAQFRYVDFLYGCYWPGKWSGNLNYFTVRENRERLFSVRGKSNYNTTDLIQLKTAMTS